jgi:hypothetical protein
MKPGRRHTNPGHVRNYSTYNAIQTELDSSGDTQNLNPAVLSTVMWGEVGDGKPFCLFFYTVQTFLDNSGSVEKVKSKV